MASEDVWCDVLVVGAGPAGFMAALTLARYNINVRIIDARPERIQTGHAGGVQPRTQEILQTLNLRHRLDIQGNHVSETAFWSINEQDTFERTHIGGEIQNPTPYPWILSIPQRETERAFDEDLNTRGCTVERPVELIDFTYTDDAEYPLLASVKNQYTNITSVYRTKYIIGSDGAASKTRSLLGFGSKTHGNDDVWCVADCYLDTNFPDVRRRCAIRSKQGGIMLIPNPRDMNRIYTQLDTTDLDIVENGGLNGVNGDISNGDKVLLRPKYGDVALLQLLRKRVKDVVAPYKMEINKLVWISQYRLRQRIVESFWDQKRVFIVGDACHTHSPKAAQGLNVSMADSYNLTWKLALVLKGKSDASILESYAIERRQLAQELLDFDAKFSHLFGRKDFLDNSKFHDVYDKAHGFTSGVGQQYQPGPLTAVDESSMTIINSGAVEPLTPGKRLYPFNTQRHIDGTPLNILDDFPSNGRFHLVVFVGNAILNKRLGPLIDYLASEDSVLTRFDKTSGTVWGFEDIYSTSQQNRHRIIDMFLFHTDDKYQINLDDLPAPLNSWKYRIYSDKDSSVHASLGVDPEVGAMALVRPDGFISLVTGLNEGDKITTFLSKYLN
uniref:Phenol 2-monooxygenase n=1 Tax=Talaromyces marneffei PM1 TaxID=1077442 RepID=A0A093UWV5_TALMA